MIIFPTANYKHTVVTPQPDLQPFYVVIIIISIIITSSIQNLAHLTLNTTYM